jgi:Gpi18-like mannosyltransferase
MAIAPHGGFPNDLSFDGNLADQLAKGNPIVIPGPPLFVHWPYLYVLFVISHIAHLFGAVPTPWWLLKLPGVLGDLALALSVTRLVGKVSSGTIEVLAKLRLWGAALILFNPAIIFVSAVWGQADSLIAFLALEAFLLLFTGRQIWWREGLGWFLFTIAIADKPQLVVIFPLVFVVAWGRTLGAHNHGLAM